MKIFSVYDKAVKAYLPPFMCRAHGEAVRSFTEAVNDPAKSFGRHATDYLLVYLGEFDDGTGLYDCHEPVRVVSASEVLVSDVIPPV